MNTPNIHPNHRPDMLADLSDARRHDVVTARSVAADAAALLLGRRGDQAICRKPDGSIVTAADISADNLIASRLHAAFPDDAILSEEAAARFDGGRTWVVDPLDGTTNFAAGLPVWGVTMALLENGVPTVGVSVFPCLGLDYTAILGGGAWEGTRRLGPAGDPSPHLGPDDLIAQCSRTAARFALDLPAARRSLGSTAFHLAMVAAGTCRASVTVDAGIWDVAAGWLLVSEAGGTVADEDGRSPWPLDRGDWSMRRVTTLAAGDAPSYAAVRRAMAAGDDGAAGDGDGVRSAA
ncbi:MAG: inositol monophosphatase family protein [Ardenticatenales bacterium]